MTSQQLDDERIFHIARGIADVRLRADYLDQICAGDLALRERVDALLTVHEQEQSFLNSAKPDVASTVDQKPITESPGQEIGRYKLLQKIGEGGFGVVFMAEQLRPVRRKVALKVIKPGMDSSAIVARFEAERQALALMDHVNIARVLDGGATESGRPYFVMELVKGVPITEYCDKNQLPTEERLKLFMTVCQAVQHAHQKGIIHRDLKPSNVLVTLADGRSVAKVIDFGVAKATSQQLTEKTLFTAFGQMIGTPQYMSPEQAEMSCLDVDTRSDVYSLGVILYELLTGTTPLETERLRTAGYAEMQRMIREEAPPRPSARLSTSGDQLTIIASHRSVTPDQLQRQVRGDLDWIVMKALEKDRGRRYESASSLAKELSRYLYNEPVDARSPTLAYRASKYLRKNRVTLSVATFIIGLLSLGLGVASYQKRQVDAAILSMRSEILDRMLEAAVRGDANQLDSLLDRSESYKIPLAWRDFLRGLEHFHSGRISESLAKFNESIDSEPNNPPAIAMAAICELWQDHALEARLRLADLAAATDRPDYETYDRAFRSFADVYRSPVSAMESLKETLDDRPLSITARLFYAAALSHSALIQGDFSLAEQAFSEMQTIEHLVGETPVIAMVHLFVCTVALDMSDEQGPQRSLVEQTATRVADFDIGIESSSDQFPLWHAVRGMYLESINEPVKASKEWQESGRHGVYLEPFVVGLLTGVRTYEQVQEIDSLDIRSKAFVVAENDLARKELLAEINASKEPRLEDIDALLFLGKLDAARNALRKYTAPTTGFGDYLQDAKPYQLLKSPQLAESLLRQTADSRLSQHRVLWVKGLLEMCDAEFDAASQSFKECSELHQINSAYHYASKAIHQRLERHDGWPSWISPAMNRN